MECIKFYCDNINNSSAKLAFYVDPVFYKTASSICRGSLIQVKNVRMNVIQGLISFRTLDVLEISLIDVMKQLVTAGIPQYFDSYYSDNFLGRYEEIKEKTPKVLTLDDLLFGFNLWLCACGFSTIGFVIEILFYIFYKILKKYVFFETHFT